MSESTPPATPADKAVTLSIYDWHALLAELEYLLSICNRNRNNAMVLYSDIATQLSGREVDLFKEEAEKKAKQQASIKAAAVDIVRQSTPAKPSFWRRLLKGS